MMLLNCLQKSHEFYEFFQINHAKEAFYGLFGTPQHILCCKHVFSRLPHLIFLKMQRSFIQKCCIFNW